MPPQIGAIQGENSVQRRETGERQLVGELHAHGRDDGDKRLAGGSAGGLHSGSIDTPADPMEAMTANVEASTMLSSGTAG
jgi:hypothetical protein